MKMSEVLYRFFVPMKLVEVLSEVLTRSKFLRKRWESKVVNGKTDVNGKTEVNWR